MTHFNRHFSGRWSSVAALLLSALILAIAVSEPASAHPEDDFCEAGAEIDPELCRKLAAANSGDARAYSPLLDDDGAVRSPLDTALMYTDIGVRHILPGGADHILFVLALFLASERLRSLIIQISAFTVAHTVTLGLAGAGFINPPAAIVEPLIALSIAFVAAENLLLREMSAWRPLVVFGFGLFHGLGFAGFVRDVGLPPGQFWSSLIGFNLGVEIGQLAVVAAALLIRQPLKLALARVGATYRAAIVAPASALIAAIGLWWAITRALGI
ncbi:MAG: HupE/UreJ family protein [Pseudomonadota bacterium]